uniref:Uncharacterized protein n=1 Tax=Anguilla anguilla TaxID=7936 RepID=A0A0E9WGD2_ANGAN
MMPFPPLSFKHMAPDSETHSSVGYFNDFCRQQAEIMEFKVALAFHPPTKSTPTKATQKSQGA